MHGGRDGLAIVPPSTSTRRRLIRCLALLVFLGLWLMHGMSATTGAGCHGVPVMMPMSAAVSEPPSIPSPASVSATVHGGEKGARLARSAFEQSGSAELCLSGQPPSPGDLLIALLAALAVFGIALFAAPTLWPARKAPGAWRRRGPPGLVGRELLTAVCVSRT